MKYYFCRQDLFKSHGAIEIDGHNNTTGQYLWTAGHRIKDDLGLQALLLDPAYGENFPAFFDTTVPVMSNELIEKFQSLGVDNFDRYQVKLKRKGNGKIYDGCQMINFPGCVDAFDREKSGFDSDAFKHRGPFVVDESKVQGLSAFRLLEPTSLLAVNEVVANALKQENFFALLIQNTEDFDGF